MKTFMLLALTVTLLLSAGCAGALPLEPPDGTDNTDNIDLQGQDGGQVQKKTCGGNSAILTECKGAVPVLSDRR